MVAIFKGNRWWFTVIAPWEEVLQELKDGGYKLISFDRVTDYRTNIYVKG
jgi:hypothetical protein